MRYDYQSVDKLVEVQSGSRGPLQLPATGFINSMPTFSSLALYLKGLRSSCTQRHSQCKCALMGPNMCVDQKMERSVSTPTYWAAHTAVAVATPWHLPATKDVPSDQTWRLLSTRWGRLPIPTRNWRFTLTSGCVAESNSINSLRLEFLQKNRFGHFCPISWPKRVFWCA